MIVSKKKEALFPKKLPVGDDNAAADDAVDAVEGEKRVTEHPADKGRGAGCTAFGARQ